MNSLNAIYLAGNLILGLGTSVEVPISGENVWISDPSTVQATALSAQKIVFKALNKGEFYFHTGGEKVTRGYVVNRQNLKAFKKCPQSKDSVQFTKEGKVVFTRNKSPNKSCGFVNTSSKIRDTIIFRLDLFEFSKSNAQEVGIDWPQKHQIFSSEENAIAAVFSQAKSNGKLLASPRLRTVPGIKAEFNTGGEIPINDVQYFGSKTSWKSYGLNVQITPREDYKFGDDELSTLIEIEYSQPDYGNASNGVPAIISRNLKNEFRLKMNRSTLLTSMIQIRKGESRKGLWSLSNLPLLGLLFSSESKSSDESELWFMISPKWAESSTGDIGKKWYSYE